MRFRVRLIAWDVPDAAATVAAVVQGVGTVAHRLKQARREALTVRTWACRHQDILAQRGASERGKGVPNQQGANTLVDGASTEGAPFVCTDL
jgi:hypothetical protein